MLEAIDQIRDPAALGAWLTTATRRTALRRLQGNVREQITDDVHLGDGPDDHHPEAALLVRERRTVLAAAIARLPHRHRQLMTLLLSQPALAYREITDLLSMPTGSIGPIRARSLLLLASDPQLRALSDTSTMSVRAVHSEGREMSRMQHPDTTRNMKIVGYVNSRTGRLICLNHGVRDSDSPRSPWVAMWLDRRRSGDESTTAVTCDECGAWLNDESIGYATVAPHRDYWRRRLRGVRGHRNR